MTIRSSILGGKWVQTPAVTLTNAQFLSLPTLPVTITPLPGAGFWIADFVIPFQGRFTGGAYTVDVDAYLWLRYSGGDLASNYVANDSSLTPARTYLTDLTAAVNFGGVFQPYVDTVETSQWGNLAQVLAAPTNQALEILADNAGAFDFTGGNAANTFVLRPYVLVVPVP